MFLNLCLALFLLWCECIQINAQCTIKGSDIKDTVSGQDNADEILQLLNRLNNHGQNIQRQFEKLLNQTERQGDEKKDEILALTIANQLQNRLDSKIENLEFQFQKMLNQTEIPRNENKDALAQAIANQISQLHNRLDNLSQSLKLQFQGINDHILQHQNLLDNQTQLQFQNLINQTERQAKIATQGIADQILQLQNRLGYHDQTVQLLCRKVLNQSARDILDPIPLLRDCSDISASGQRTSGVCVVYVEHQQKLYSANAFCDMTSINGTSWLVFQRRENGSVDFYRNWTEYETGFGDPNGEFWLGNEMLHLLTSKRNYKLRVDLEDFEGNRRYAEYARFSIGSQEDKYRLAVSGYSGNAGDALSYNDGKQFSTKDAYTSFNCAELCHGAWWYLFCSMSNLNGKYQRGNYSESLKGVFWYPWRGW